MPDATTLPLSARPPGRRTMRTEFTAAGLRVTAWPYGRRGTVWDVRDRLTGRLVGTYVPATGGWMPAGGVPVFLTRGKKHPAWRPSQPTVAADPARPVPPPVRLSAGWWASAADPEPATRRRLRTIGLAAYEIDAGDEWLLVAVRGSRVCVPNKDGEPRFGWNHAVAGVWSAAGGVALVPVPDVFGLAGELADVPCDTLGRFLRLLTDPTARVPVPPRPREKKYLRPRAAAVRGQRTLFAAELVTTGEMA